MWPMVHTHDSVHMGESIQKTVSEPHSAASGLSELATISAWLCTIRWWAVIFL